MSGEPQPPDVGDQLDRQLHGLKAIWFGLFAGGFVITLAVAMIVMSGGGPGIDLGVLKYVFLIPVLFGLVGAFALVPWLTAPEPPPPPEAGLPPGLSTNPDDPLYWYPAYMTRFLLRGGFLEGNAILCAIGFFITGDWLILAGPIILLAALLAYMPTRASVESFAADARQRMRSGE